MKKMTTDKRVSLLATIISVVLILVGIVGLFLIQFSVDESQDLRQQASVDQGQVTLTSSFTPPQDTISDLVVDQVEAIDFAINTGGLQVDGLQFVFNILTDDFTSSPEVVLDPATNLEAAYQEVQQTADGYLVGLILHNDQFGTFGTSQDTKIFSVRFTPKTAGTISFNFDREQSQALAANTNPPEDELTHVDTFTYTVVDLTGGATPTPTPTPTATPVTTASPTVNPTTSPTAQSTVAPTATPVITTTTSTGVGGANLASCNQSCASNNDCQANFRCYQNNCRLVTNVSSSSCEDPGSQGLQKSCNQACNNTGECATGLMCYQGSCRNPVNANNTSCQNVTVIVQEQMAASCGQSCDSNNDCATNLTCYQGSCRLATNPSSLSCSATTQSTVSTTYDQNKGGSASPSPTTSSSPTATPSTSPTATPGASVSPTPQITAVPFGGTTATPSPSPQASVVPFGADELEETERSALAEVISNLQDRGSAFPLAMIGSGLFLVLLVILFFFLRRRGGQATPPPAPPQNPQYKQQVENLQTRINSLQQQSGQAGSPIGGATPPPPSSVARPTPMPPAPAAPAAPSFGTPAPTPSSPGMVGKLKQRGTAFGPGQQIPPNPSDKPN